MGLTALVHGFKLSVAAFDAFLEANGRNGTCGYKTTPEDDADIATLFRDKGVDCEVRVFIPHLAGFNLPHHLYVCYDWIFVLVTKEIEGELEKPIPASFEEMRRKLGAESGISKYIVVNDDVLWAPEELVKWNTAPIKCGVCDDSFESWQRRMKHRHDQHGILEEFDPLPDC
ncbi:hypothetical protein GLAREA_11117 [Glarea lozoyensis ATCC 20868]|uniref:C2H2-type domain-containing protein n=1 Tax=Glarea lozoyensis (strain ATCC 20868 / MF5171) TaxID=1116229 RepID=S3EAR7_GLAL2|nr:uncharacterized protein GLAREA_11117 [Glarea lozoyensis ATCC 20868]EPE35418.1 hypothetical protein GLAREA_11117 [Glarea lozoyensis ATCC 20868]